MSHRIFYLDVARGLGCLLVVLGHNRLVSWERGAFFSVIFSFHIPLFFFLSGLFLNVDGSLSELARKRGDALLKPFFVTFLLLAVDDVLLQAKVDPLEYLKGVLYANGLTIPWMPLWFLPHLWLLSILAWLVCRNTRIERWPALSKGVVLFAAIGVGSAVIDVFVEAPLDWPRSASALAGLPFSLDLALISGAYLIAGYLLRDPLRGLSRVDPWVFVGTAVAFAGIHAIEVDTTMDLNLRRYDHVVLSTAAAALGIYLTFAVAWLLATHLRAVARPVAYVGSGSLFILVFHQVFQDKVSSWLSARLPESAVLTSLAAFAVAVVVPLVGWEIVKRVPPLSFLFLPVAPRRHRTVAPSVSGRSS